MAALKNPKHEAFCREVAGGQTPAQAWVSVGNNAAANNVGRLMARQEIKGRIVELQREFSKASGISVNYLQEKLMPIATSDVTRYFKRAAGGKLKLRDVTKLPPELRAALSELRVDPDGSVTVKLWDKVGANNTLLKSVGGFAPQRIELTGDGVDWFERAGALTPLDTVRRLTWSVREALRAFADDPDTQALGARWIIGAANSALGDPEHEIAVLETSQALPPTECARQALIAMAKCAQRVAPDAEAASFLARTLRRIAEGIEESAALKIDQAPPSAGASG